MTNVRSAVGASTARGGFLALACAIAGLAFSPLLARISDIGPSATAVHRVLLALPLLLVWMWWEQRDLGRVLLVPRQDWIVLVVAGLLWTGDLVAWHWALQLTTIANASLLTMTAPIFVTAGAWLLFRERITAGFVAGLAIAFVGVALLIGASGDLDFGNLLGDAVAVSAALFYSTYMLAIKRLRGGLPTGTIMFFSCLFSLPGLVVAAMLSGETLLAPNLAGWAKLLGLALSAQVIGQACIAFALARLPASFTSVAMMVQPGFAIALAWAILDEAVSWNQVAGGAVVLVGVLVSRRYGLPTRQTGER